MFTRIAWRAFAVLLVAAAVTVADAQQMVYTPRNPHLYQAQLQAAQAQNDFTEEREPTLRNPMDDFERNLQRQILSALSRELIGGRFGDMDLTQEGQYDFGDFTVEIIPGLNGITIRIFNVLTGDESVVTIPAF